MALLLPEAVVVRLKDRLVAGEQPVLLNNNGHTDATFSVRVRLYLRVHREQILIVTRFCRALPRFFKRERAANTGLTSHEQSER